jgi:hypothetical protein
MTPTDSPAFEPSERRAFIRHARRLETLWTYLGLDSNYLTGGEVFDLSTTGVGLVLDTTFTADTTLVIRLPTATLGWSSHLVRVKRCDEVRPGRFRVGCAFVKPLAEAELNALLSRRG